MSSEEPRMEHDFDPLIPEELEGCHEMYSSASKFIEFLTGTADSLCSEKTRGGCVFWTPQRDKTRDDNASRSRTVQEKIILALQKLEWPYLFVQFWALNEFGGRRYLTTSDQPFAVAYLFKGLCWYRKESLNHKYMVDEEEHLGPPGRVFRSGFNPESSPDLLLYSMEEFPLRNLAASCGLRSCLALPVFDVGKDDPCIGVLEFLNFQSGISFPSSEIQRIDSALKVADMRSTQKGTSTVESLIYDQQPQLLEVREMLEMAIKRVPQLHLVQVWVPCEQSSHTSNDYGMKRADFINNVCAKTNSLVGVSKTTCEFVYTCEFQKIHSEQKIVGLAMSSPNKACFCRSLSEFNISEYPLVHYAQRARLSSCFAICLKSDDIKNKNDQYVFEFFLQPQSRDDEYICSLLGSLIHIMEMELKSFKIANDRHLRDIVVVDEIHKKNMFSCLESAQKSVSESIQYSSKKEHQISIKNTLVEPMDESNDRFTLSEFKEHLEASDWSCLQAPLRGGYGWICRSIKREIIESNYKANNDLIFQEDIKLLLRKILSIWTGEANPSLLIQFWRKKVIESRLCLSTSDQPFALGCLSTELCSFRMECMKHDYYIGDGAKEEKLGPIRRVFLNRHPESSPDVRLYSNREFPLIQEHFLPSGARRYLALPLFDLHSKICIGVLEFVGCPFDFEDIVEKLEATNLTSVHINHHAGFKESCFPPKNVVGGQQVAFNEISEMIELVMKSPQLHVASVWVPCSECNHIDIKRSCFELVRFSDIDLLEPSDRVIHDFIKACRFLRLQPREGVIGRILESENMLSFCQNFCDFSIIEQPLVHYAQLARLDIYFVICLQSSHTGNRIYILEFFLSHGHPWSLCSLLSVMKQKLKSFKVASGQQLGRELISEAIELCKGEEFTYLQSGYLDSLPLKSKTTQYDHKMEPQEHFKFDSLGSSGKNENEEQSLSGITFVEDETSKRKRSRFDISDEDRKLHIEKRQDVEKESGVSRKMKRVRRKPDWERRPSYASYVTDKTTSLSETKTENKSLHEFDTQVGKACQESDVVMIKAKFKDDVIKFELFVSSGLEIVQEEVAMRLKLKIGSFELGYLDEEHDNKWCSLACDDDLHQRVKNLKTLGKATVLLFARSTPTELDLSFHY